MMSARTGFVAASALAVALSGMSSTASAQPVYSRAHHLEYYPCADNLSDDGLSYLAEWTNATKTDPCMLDEQQFIRIFGVPMSETPTVMSAPSDPYKIQAMEHVQTYFGNGGPEHLFSYQVLMLGIDSADGVWGAQTEAAFRQALDAYTAIYGAGDGNGIDGTYHVFRLLRWIEEDAYNRHKR